MRSSFFPVALALPSEKPGLFTNRVDAASCRIIEKNDTLPLLQTGFMNNPKNDFACFFGEQSPPDERGNHQGRIGSITIHNYTILCVPCQPPLVNNLPKSMLSKSLGIGIAPIFSCGFFKFSDGFPLGRAIS
jgi:hypothetical protein